ncbi:ABC1 kinase family protein [Pragia fontium]|uniref:Ubiquinone biosynthesis protein n=2 Tax=Pragia fontium TaxID=82985 RepID=A0AAJ5BI09_9GAMM|nr:AarF/UbiB family protein [Pragia fontium]AKJ40803.1 ABC transporter [Pragia fontium]SFD16610.1 ubiquinone biosynthesis protein [Pragia fontium DSM 5563 = ATCC 49100]SUB80982.1 Probable ubiquinone biosynthesis protein UbiB [Pragia fontium]VEJ52815.1 Probable ubiquinone biosynthesis protein UbiB [Pragia fontium]GKX64324.1 putative protein kinase UbiB [Pragia fontium]
MLLKTVYVTTRDRVRLKEIGQVLLSYGLQDLIRILGLSTLLGNPLNPQKPVENQPQQLRRALESLGPTFVKLGQILATRADLLDERWTSELEKLHSNVATLPWQDICQRVSDSLGASPDEVFAEFCTTPLAAASMAQVYRARLHSGEEVVIKVLRPGLEKTINADLRLLAWLAEVIEQQSPELARFHPLQLVRQLSTALHHELDLNHEASNTQYFAQNFEQRPNIVIPRIWPEYSSSCLLVQEYIPGIKPSSAEQLAQSGFDGPLLAKRGAEAFMQMVFEDRLYHADPHAGNLMAIGDNQVAFIDFGMVGQLSARRRNQLLMMLRALAERESEGLVSTLIGWSDEGVPDAAVLELAAQDFFDRLGPGELQLGKALLTMLSTAREYQLNLPPDLVLLFKALITADGVLHRLDPDFDIIQTLEPFLRKEMVKHYGLKASRQRMRKIGLGMIDASEDFPQTLSLLLRRLRHGKPNVDINVSNLQSLANSLERSAITLAIAVVTGAFALGISPWLISSSWTIFGIPIFQTVSMLLVAAGIFLLVLRLRK